MAKKKAVKPVNAVAEEKGTKPVRLDLSLDDHDRLAKCAKRYGLTKASYVRMSLFERIEADEKGMEGRS